MSGGTIESTFFGAWMQHFFVKIFGMWQMPQEFPGSGNGQSYRGVSGAVNFA
jgi:hypothetical protein